jgi:nitroimidazol reductase NimA-like FMN-containing flavoprotein (pyridoxamine 5'-phosphate oxidase superfamily)
MLTEFEDVEIEFLRMHELCRFATVSRDDLMPQVTPVVYALDQERFVVAVDYGTRKLKNVKENPNVSLVVDDYGPNRAVMVQGSCTILEEGQEYLRLLKILFERFEFYREHPWGEGESPILSVTPTKVVSWGIRR